MTVSASRAVASAVGIELLLLPRSARLGDLERQVDKRHSAVVEAVLGALTSNGWQTCVEYSFNYFGDRGCVDALAWHGQTRSLLIIEVKSELRDVQATLHAMDVKRRVVPGLVRQEKQWFPEAVGVLMVLPDIRTERDRVARHHDTFAVALPSRSVEVRRWIQRPEGGLRGIWFLRVSQGAFLTQRVRGPQRIRRSSSAGRTSGSSI